MDGTAREAEALVAKIFAGKEDLLDEICKVDSYDLFINPVWKYLGSVSGVNMSHGGYSSAAMQQKAERMRQYLMQQQMQSGGGWSAGLPHPHTVTAISGYGPAYHGAYPSVDAQVDATVSTSTPTVQEARLERRKLNYPYWLTVVAASILSIWPAWGPQLRAACLPNHPVSWLNCRHHGEPIFADPQIEAQIQNGNWQYRWFRIETVDHHVRYVKATHWVDDQDGNLQIKNVQDNSIVYQIAHSQVRLLTEESP